MSLVSRDTHQFKYSGKKMTGIWKFANKDYKINYKHAQRFKGKYEHNER